MLRFKTWLGSGGEEIKELCREACDSPVLACNKICYGYLNNDWMMVFSNVAVLTFSTALIFFSFLNNKALSA